MRWEALAEAAPWVFFTALGVLVVYGIVTESLGIHRAAHSDDGDE